MGATRKHSQKAQRTSLLGIRLFPEEHVAFKDLADGQGYDMTELAYEALAARYPHVFSGTRTRVVAHTG